LDILSQFGPRRCEQQILSPLFVTSFDSERVSFRAHGVALVDESAEFGATPTIDLRHCLLLHIERERGHVQFRVAEVSQALACRWMRQRWLIL
jgi:hypothetical protein